MSDTPQIVAIGGLPGCGKTSAVQPYLARGFTQVSRDKTGGSLKTLDSPFYEEVRRVFRSGSTRIVVDNTLCFKRHRDCMVAVAKELGVPIHLVMLDVDVPQAQLFAARRQVQRYGKLFTKADYEASDDPNMFPPPVQFRFAKELKAARPSTDEGFASVKFVPVKTVWGAEYTGKAIILDLDGTVRETKTGIGWPRTPDEVHVLDGCGDVLRAKLAEGYRLLGATNQSGINRKDDDPKYVSEANVVACIEATCKGLGVDIEVLYAPDRGGPPNTYWRKPCPGMGVVFIEKYKLDPAQCILVGDMKSDKTFAERCGFQFEWADAFFGR